jgi:hypothetical protein
LKTEIKEKRQLLPKKRRGRPKTVREENDINDSDYKPTFSEKQLIKI